MFYITKTTVLRLPSVPAWVFVFDLVLIYLPIIHDSINMLHVAVNTYIQLYYYNACISSASAPPAIMHGYDIRMAYIFYEINNIRHSSIHFVIHTYLYVIYNYASYFLTSLVL